MMKMAADSDRRCPDCGHPKVKCVCPPDVQRARELDRQLTKLVRAAPDRRGYRSNTELRVEELTTLLEQLAVRTAKHDELIARANKILAGIAKARERMLAAKKAARP